MKPLFEVGEEVILCSKNYPELNGDTVVLEVQDPELDELDNLTYGYRLTIEICKGNPFWSETALRKKYKGVDFNEMMKDIKQNKPVEV